MTTFNEKAEMADKTRPTLAELQADGLTPDIMIMMIDAQRAMAGEYVCHHCGARGDDQKKIEACTLVCCGFRTEHGVIAAPYMDESELLATRRHYEQLAASAATSGTDQ